jgi:hypothetical protein
MSDKKGRKWDGISRVSNDLYRKNFENIFGKKSQLVDENVEDLVDEKWSDPDNEDYES